MLWDHQTHPVIDPTAEHGCHIQLCTRQGWSRSPPEEAMLGEAALPHLNLSFEVPSCPVLTTKQSQHEPFEAEL